MSWPWCTKIERVLQPEGRLPLAYGRFPPNEPADDTDARPVRGARARGHPEEREYGDGEDGVLPIIEVRSERVPRRVRYIGVIDPEWCEVGVIGFPSDVGRERARAREGDEEGDEVDD